MNRSIALFNLSETDNTFFNRFRLSWRQLSYFWNLSVAEYQDLNCLSNINAEYFSIALSEINKSNEFKINQLLSLSPAIVFCNNVSIEPLDCEIRLKSNNKRELGYKFKYTLKVEDTDLHDFLGTSSFTVFGPPPSVTVLPETGEENILLSIDHLPVITSYKTHLFIGVDPWQLGAPTIPMLYPIIFSWLRQFKPINVHKPAAYVRFDDLPVTALHINYAKYQQDDRKSAKILNCIRKYAISRKIKFTLMYSTHFHLPNGEQKPLSKYFPLSINEMHRGIFDGVFDIGAHGMIHLNEKSEKYSKDPNEFIYLDETATRQHLIGCLKEIEKIFNSTPISFVAPAWGYKPGITKKIASEYFSIIIDSSQHLEAGECDPFGSVSSGGMFLNLIETFRKSTYMLPYSDPIFWRFYALAGIPVSYMQHSLKDYSVIFDLISILLTIKPIGSEKLYKKILGKYTNPGTPKPFRILLLSFALIIFITSDFFNNISILQYIWKALFHNSILSITDALLDAGYDFFFISEYKGNSNVS